MMRPRVIPVLTINGEGLYRTRAFKNPVYIGDPLNALRIFNEKEVDELFVFDTSEAPSLERWELVNSMASEAFMPMGYGGHLSSLQQIEDVFRAGYEKVVLNTWAERDPNLLREAVATFGGQSIVVSIDVRKSWTGREQVFTDRGRHKTGIEPVKFVRECVDIGIGEILIRSIPHDGQMQGMALDLIGRVASEVAVPVVAIGGAGNKEHLKEALLAGAHAVAAGSMFVFQGPRRAVLISYLSPKELESLS